MPHFVRIPDDEPLVSALPIWQMLGDWFRVLEKTRGKRKVWRALGAKKKSNPMSDLADVIEALLARTTTYHAREIAALTAAYKGAIERQALLTETARAYQKALTAQEEYRHANEYASDAVHSNMNAAAHSAEVAQAKKALFALLDPNPHS